jgi:DDE superfamily endonuclease
MRVYAGVCGCMRVYAILDNLSAHRATDVLLVARAHPRWEFVFQPKYAAYLNLIEPWWKILRALALKGRRFETWDEVCRAVAAATSYWNVRTSIAIRFSGDIVDAIGLDGNRASPSPPLSHKLGGWTT